MSWARKPRVPKGAREWPVYKRNESVQHVIEMYDHGYAGTMYDEEAREILFSSLPYPNGEQAAYDFNLVDSGKGELSIPFIYAYKHWPKCWPSPGQTTGDCVSHAGKNCGIVLIGVEAELAQPDPITNKIEGYPEVTAEAEANGVVACENIYGARGHSGEGASCDRLINYVIRDGGIMLRQNYPDLGINFTEYNADYGIRWGSGGTPEKINAVARQHQIRTSTNVESEDTARDFIANGYPLWACSDLGFSNKRDDNGFSERSGSWAHSWIVMGYDDRKETKDKYGEPLCLFNHDWGCYSDDTEVLTRQGWKLFRDVTMTDEIATLNRDTHHLEYQQPTKLFEYDYKGYLWKYATHGVDLMVTDNHNLYVAKTNKDLSDPESWELSQARDTIAHVRMKKDAIWIGEEIPIKEVGRHRIPMNDWLEFLGLFIAEGSTTYRQKVRQHISMDGSTSNILQKDYITAIAAKDKKKLAKAEAIVSRMPFKLHKTLGGWRTGDKELFAELRSLGKAGDKHVPDYCKDLPPSQLHHLFIGLMAGDGSLVQTATGPRQTYYTSSPRLADDMQEIVLKIGGAANISFTDRRGRDNGHGGVTKLIEYRVGIRFKATTPKPNAGYHPLLIPYSGKIYCAEVPNHVMYVRRNGKAVWCGNSWQKGGRRILGTNIDIPDGSFWFRASLLKKADLYAMSSIDGWPRRQLPDWSSGWS